MIPYLRGRRRWAFAAAQLGAFLFGCFLIGVFSVRTSRGVALVLLMGCLVVYWIKPQLMAGAALFLAFATLPDGLHVGMIIGPVAIYASHVAVLLAIGYLIPIAQPRFADLLLPGMFALTIVFFSVAGFAADNAVASIVHEATFLFELVLGFVLALTIIGADYAKGAMHALAATLWFSSGLIVASSLHIIKLSGRTETLQDTASTAEATRLLTTSATVSMAVLTALVAGQIIGRVPALVYLSFAPPALIISLLGFSRATLMAMGVAAAVAIVSTFDWSALHRTASFVAITAAVFAMAVPGALFLLQHSAAGTWLDYQFMAYNRRVLGGVSTGALAVDDSLLERFKENSHLKPAIAGAPFFGHGMGYAYQLPFGYDPDSFTMTLGTTYAHNFYLWWLVKSGAVGMAGFAMLAITPIVRALRSASPLAKIAAATSAGLLATCTVGPMPEEVGDSLVLGLTFGAAFAFATQIRRIRIEIPENTVRIPVAAAV
ncbi:O-antigen ligase family protein [Mycobacterium sp. M1]|uniref:O-antigen ligase family protein n=1 Tax=Mycolicibacter acidiphilus TaxID=2835306 RepID=A0ABS5RGV9_9MYCO|nr:O-antigen ligase family protein [Mycolicibacter acidiphilus]MBS9533516.1 O-antigen ligase family protein [Mycolicibacter acidiphilus]